MTLREDEDRQLNKFWELEEVTSEKSEKKITQDEEVCEKTVQKCGDGRYTVQIPFNSNKEKLEKWRPRAAARLIQSEKRLSKNEDLCNNYKKFMQEYLDMEHMVRVPESQEFQRKYYIPHQAVIREESTTTKLRVVFDVSCKTSSGVSDPIQEYKVITVTYGTAAAPYLAIKTLQQLEKNKEKQFPAASSVAKDDFYVDDLLSGSDTEEETTKLQDELIHMMKNREFTLRKWYSTLIKSHYEGNQQTLAFVRRKFWIINRKKAVKFLINKCTRCIRYKEKTAQQLMGQLPAAKVTPASPFEHTGMDYAGPIQEMATKGRGHKLYKRYIAVFVHLTTEAVHLEVVSDMSSEAFLAAYRNFIARRGQCAHIYCDNGTTFVGTKNILESEVQEMIQTSNFQDEVATIGTQWHFISPAAPH
ncbi:hypothetical protein TcasGA2_TC016140 [Tribolium castaneum]|uniref:Integrase catalytic domain-containing protein n=1 Tax=Tribolium castaneum TaxID=7070 RepID=D7ELZ1_TRICA|nr:hypothetical protein TcasGA2_TC016140 [Tribolium castaneum]